MEIQGHPSSIYSFVRHKLLRHGAKYTGDGELTISDKKLFLAFVRLERAVRLQDFESVRSAVAAIEARALDLQKRHLAIFAYMYLYLSDITAKHTHADVDL